MSLCDDSCDNVLCVLFLPRLVEDGVVQLQETDKNVEGMEEEALCPAAVLILSVCQTLVNICDCQPEKNVTSGTRLSL